MYHSITKAEITGKETQKSHQSVINLAEIFS